jgi:iron complex outermembrane receptor protein
MPNSNNSFAPSTPGKTIFRAGTGLINDHFTVDARLSSIRSDGYIDRASSNLKSYYVSAAWLNDHSSLRLNVFSGKEKTYQAWLRRSRKFIANEPHLQFGWHRKTRRAL